MKKLVSLELFIRNGFVILLLIFTSCENIDNSKKNLSINNTTSNNFLSIENNKELLDSLIQDNIVKLESVNSKLYGLKFLNIVEKKTLELRSDIISNNIRILNEKYLSLELKKLTD